MRLNDRSRRETGTAWLKLYPRAWRDRYGDEMAAVLEARPLAWRTRLDLVLGALDAHVHPTVPPRVPVLPALAAGVAWIIAGLAPLTLSLPDWPGYLLETLPIGLIGAISSLLVVLAVGRRSGFAGPRGTGSAVVVSFVAHVAWIVALLVALLGGPYGAITGAAQSIAAVGVVLVGLVRARAADRPVADAVMIAGTAMLIPSPAAWPVAGVAWIALAIIGVRPTMPLRPA